MKILIMILMSMIFLSGCESRIKVDLKKNPKTTSPTNDTSSINFSRACSPQPSNSTGGLQSSTNNNTWSDCSGFICNAGYMSIADNCVLTNQTQSCSIINGTGSQDSTDGGQTWSSCAVASCNASYTNVSNSCVLTNQTQSCSITNGTGSQNSTNGGVSWGTCNVVSCNAAYTNVSNSCVQTNQTQSCAITNGTGSQNSTDGGQTWGSCTVVSCNTTYTNVSNSCVLANQTQSCAITNGTGSQSSTDGGQTWGTCNVVSCNATYTNVSNSCVLANQTQSCAITNGTGSQNSTDGGQTWNTCNVVSCDATYTNVSNSCVLTNQTRACSSQPTNSTGGTESSTDGGVSWGSCLSFSCNTNYTSNGSSCILNTYDVTINKLTNVGRIQDTSLGKIDCLNNCTSQTESYDHGSMIVLETTPAAGYAVTGWTGCDSVSGDNLTCTISSIQSNRTVTPTFQETYQTISASWANASIGDASSGFDIYKNGSLCTTTCLSEVILTDTIRVVANVGSFIEDVSLFSTTGSPSSINTATTNEISFTMGSQNVNVEITAIDKDIVISNSSFLEVTLRTNSSDLAVLGSNNAGAYFLYYSESNPVRHRLSVSSSYMTNDREIDIYDDLTCTNKVVTLSTVGQNVVNNNFAFNLNSTSTYSFKVRNVTKESSCIKYTLYHQGSITKTIETITMNESIENSSGYNSFFTDDTNTVSGLCNNINSLSNPSQHTYNYGKITSPSGILIKAEAYLNSDLVTPYYTQQVTTSCGGAGSYSETITQNANFASADVIKVSVTHTNYFGANLVDTKTMSIQTKTKSCSISNGTGSQSYTSNGSFNTCTVVSCDSGYSQSGNTCVAVITTISDSLHLGYNSLAYLTKNGELFSMGENSNQLLGDGSAASGTNANIIIPVKTSGAMGNKKIKEFARGGNVACAITTDGLGYCWGSNTDGALGDGTNNGSGEPVAIKMTGELSGKTLKKISAGYNTVCAIASDNKAYCWGYGSLGNNTYAVTQNEPRKVDDTGVLAGKTISQIEVGDDAVCLLTSESLHYCWGSRGWGLIPSATSSTNTPIQTRMTGVMVGKTYKKLAMYNGSQGGMGFACGILSDDKAYCWGYNGDGQLGNNSTANSTYQVAVDDTGALSGKTIKDIDVGAAHACALTTDDNIYCWGANGSNQVSEDAISNSLVPILKPKNGLLSGKSFSKIQLGSYETCALTTNNEWLCWGSILGSTTSPTAIYLKPELLFVNPNRNAKFSINKDNGCAIDSSNDLYCWGWNSLGVIGNGNNTDSEIPVRINNQGIINNKKFKQVSVGDTHACAIDVDGVAYCWGENTSGQLGNGNNTSSNTAVAVNFSGLYMVSSVVQISAAANYTCAIIMSNNQRVTSCWGLNTYGQLGNSTTTASNLPVTITSSITLQSAYKPLEITTAQETVCMIALLDSETLPRPFCWGRNNTTQGYLGMNNSAAAQRTHPQAVYTAGVLNNKSTRQISGDSAMGTFCVISNEYLPYCWGSSSDGQLGNNSWSQSIVPVSPDLTGVLSGKKIVSIETGTAHTCALSDSNTLHCWGRGASGQLGDGLASPSPIPVNVDMTGTLLGKDVVGLVSGFYNTCALTKDGQAHCWGWNNSAHFGLFNDYNQYDAPIRGVPTLTLDFGY